MSIVNRQQLLGILSSIKPALAKRDIIAQAQHFVFCNDEVFAYNDELFISHPFKSGIECSVKADEFQKILSKMSVDMIEMSVIEQVLHMKAGKTKAQLAVELSGVVFDMVDGLGLEALTWSPVAKNFVDGVELCMFSASADASQGALTCVSVNKADLFSTDDVRISWYNMEAPMESFLLPARAAQHMVKYNISEYCVTDSWVHFKTKDGIIFSCRQILADFPDVLEFFDGEGVRIKLPSHLRDVIERVGIMADGDIEIDKKISVKFETDKITCTGEKKGIGSIEEEVDCNYKQTPADFAINPEFFHHILEQSTVMKLMTGKALFTSSSFRHVIALPMVEGEEA